MYDNFPWFVWFTWDNRRPLPYDWAPWFAWWPVRTDDGWRWLRQVKVRIHGEVAPNGELASWTEFRPAQHQRRLSLTGKLVILYLIVAVVAFLAGMAVIVFGVRG